MEGSDLKKNGSIDYTEWLVASAHKHEQLTIENLKFAFDFFDLEQNGSIGHQEISKVFQDYNLMIDDELIEQMMLEVSNDEKLTFEDFTTLMK